MITKSVFVRPGTETLFISLNCNISTLISITDERIYIYPFESIYSR